MFDLASFWATVSLLTIPAWFVFGIFAIVGTSFFLKKASRNRFNLVEIVAPTTNSPKDNACTVLFVIGAVELVIMHIIWGITSLVLPSGVSPYIQVMNLSEWFAPVGGWLSILAILVGGTFILVRGAFDAFYRIKEIADKVDAKLAE